MKLVRFRNRAGVPAAGIVVDDGIVEIGLHLPSAPLDTPRLIADWPQWSSRLAALADMAPDHAIGAVELLTPSPEPEKILCLGLNYRDHAEEVGLPLPEAQLWFSKTNNTLSAHARPIMQPLVSQQLDHEAELVVVIGKTCRHVAREAVDDVIFGYAVGHDVSVRDCQMATSQFLLGKCFDGHAPVGPWIVTADEFRPAAQRIRCIVNGEVRQDSNIGNMVFGIDAMIEHISRFMTLKPGDLVFTGTPAGVGMGAKPPRWLLPGDRVRIEIEGIGSIENHVVPEAELM
jgi:2-keto-4-pentenoate hydratase/2-oxohepta-3-ene-1,7-dioic acid hydratase in catechol pathway